MHFLEPLEQDINRDFLEKIEKNKFLDINVEEIENITDLNIRLAMKFLYSKLPISDLSEENIYNILFSTTKNAFYAKNNTPWGNDVPLDVFLAHVLFPRISSEILEDNREIFYKLLIDRVKNKSMYDAVVETNYFSYENVTYETTDRRTAPPTTLLKTASGRCGEEAVFTVTALRSIGIPARQIYTPIWAHTDNNHAWVEAWVEGRWYYLGACEPEEVLNRGWFTSAASRAMLVESRSFYQNKNINSQKEEYIENGLVYDVNLTTHYANTKKIVVKIVDFKSSPIKDVKVSFQIINHSVFSTLNYLYTDENGECSIILGIGSLNLHLLKDGKYMEKQIHTMDGNFFEIVFENEEFKEKTKKFNTFAPTDPGNKVNRLDKSVDTAHKINMEKALNIRKKKEKDFLTDFSSIKQNHELATKKEIEDILLTAKGNGANVVKYIENNKSEYAIKLLKTLNEKDFADFDADILSSFLKQGLNYINNYDEDVFVKYILAPRIYFETIKEYKEYISNYFNEESKAEFIKNPKTIWEYIIKNIVYNEESEFYNTNVSVVGALKTKNASPLSQKILFVAICRTLGIPSRIAHETMDIEYYKNGEFVSLIEAENKDCSLKISFQDNVNWVYGTNWSISFLNKGMFVPLMLRNTEIKDNILKLKNGCYKILTSNRLPNGDVFLKQFNVILKTNEIKNISIDLRPIKIEEMLKYVEIGDFTVNDFKKDVNIKDSLTKEKNMIVWIKANHEPTQHLLNEMILSEKALKEANINIVFLLENESDFKNSLIIKTKKMFNAITLLDKDFQHKEAVARRVYDNPENTPLIIMTENKLNSIFSRSGYNVGTNDLILKIFNR